MKADIINRIEYRNPKTNLDFEITDIQRFFSARSHQSLQKDYRINFWSIMYITEGTGVHYIDFKAYHYKKGDLIFIHKNQVHRYVVNSEVKGYIIHLNEPFFYRIEGISGDTLFELIDKAFGSPLIHFDTGEDAVNRTLIDLIDTVYHKSEDSIHIELVATLFQAFMLSLKQQMSSSEKLLYTKDYDHFRRYRELVEQNYTRIRSVDEYAAMMHLSKKTINQATRSVVGLSAKQFIIDRVILEIKRYLSQGELMIYEIADELGFEEAANLSKFFKHYEGISPKEFMVRLKLKSSAP